MTPFKCLLRFALVVGFSYLTVPTSFSDDRETQAATDVAPVQADPMDGPIPPPRPLATVPVEERDREEWIKYLWQKLVAKGLPKDTPLDDPTVETALYQLEFKDFKGVQNPVLNAYTEKGLSYHYAVAAAFPHFSLKPWRFPAAPPKFWNTPQHREDFLLDVAQRQGWKTWREFYGLNLEVVNENKGGGLLSIGFTRSLYTLLTSVFPLLDWKPWRFGKVPNGYWQKKENRRAFLDDLGQIRKWTISDFRKLTRKIASQYGGGGLYSGPYYSGSTYALLQDLMPEGQWKPWELTHTPDGYWEDPAHVREFLEYVQVQKKLA